MAPKTSKSARLHELAVYVRQPDKLAELQARSGNNLSEKLRQLVPGEKVWYLFLHRNTGFEAEGQALLEELDAEVTRPPARQVASHGGSSSSCLATDGATTARVQPRQRRPAESVPETPDKHHCTHTAPITTRAETLCMRGLNGLSPSSSYWVRRPRRCASILLATGRSVKPHRRRGLWRLGALRRARRPMRSVMT